MDYSLDLVEKTAQAMLSELAMHAPHILIGRQTWVDLEDADAFAEIANMVDLMFNAENPLLLI